MISKLRLEHNCVDDSIIELMGWKMCDSHKMVVENKFKWVEGNFALTKTKLGSHVVGKFSHDSGISHPVHNTNEVYRISTAEKRSSLTGD